MLRVSATLINRCAFVLALTALPVTLVGCPDDAKPSTGNGADAGGGGAPDDEDLMGTYTVGGTEHACEVSIQVFSSSNEYSVVCQDDDDGFVQVTFKNEASARLTQSLTITERIISSHPDAASIDVSYFSFADGEGEVASRDDSTGTAEVVKDGANNRVKLDAVALSSLVDNMTATVSASVPY